MRKDYFELIKDVYCNKKRMIIVILLMLVVATVIGVASYIV